jgi:rhomboid protease GluP
MRRLDAFRSGAGRWPILTAIAAGIVTAMTLAGAHHPDLVLWLRREPAMITQGQWWRFLTAASIYSDRAWEVAVAISFLALVGSIAEWRHSRVMWVAAFAVGILTGELVALNWQPVGSGSSVGACGLLGLLLSGLLRDRTKTLAERLVWPVVGMVIAVGLCVLRDIHGPPVFAGLVVGLVGPTCNMRVG